MSRAWPSGRRARSPPDMACGVGGGVVLFDARGERLRPTPLEVKEGDVTSVAFGPEGQIAAGYGGGVGGGGGVVLFDARGERLRPTPLEVKEGQVKSVAFGPEGQIAAGYARPRPRRRGALRRLISASWRRKAGQTANRNFTRLEWTRYFSARPLTVARSDPCPGRHDLPEAERKQAEAFEKEHPEGSDASSASPSASRTSPEAAASGRLPPRPW